MECIEGVLCLLVFVDAVLDEEKIPQPRSPVFSISLRNWEKVSGRSSRPMGSAPWVYRLSVSNS
ncbi:MAG: hypothetical protein ACI92B_000255 [Marinobacter maritimus]|jgi:hypothetical protein